MRRRGAVLLALITMLAGCGVPFAGSPGPLAYAPDDGRPAIVCFGDSLTAGEGAPVDQSYPAWLQRRLDSRGYRYRVINAGTSGDRVADGLQRLDRDVLAYHPAVVIVELGSNDAGHTPASEWEAGLSVLLSRMHTNGVAVILGGLDWPGTGVMYRRLALRHRVPLVWFTDGLWSRGGLWHDAHHPNGAGYRIVMQRFWPTLLPLLRRA